MRECGSAGVRPVRRVRVSVRTQVEVRIRMKVRFRVRVGLAHLFQGLSRRVVAHGDLRVALFTELVHGGGELER